MNRLSLHARLPMAGAIVDDTSACMSGVGPECYGMLDRDRSWSAACQLADARKFMSIS